MTLTTYWYLISNVNCLSISRIFVRIDFYATDKGAVFGEFTPTPFRGLFFTPHADKLFIPLWDQYCNGLI